MVSNNNITVTAASYDNVTGLCTGIVTQVTVNIVIGYTNQEYKIISGSINVELGSATTQATITTSISITSQGTSNSGNPGYIFGKPTKYSSGSIYSIANPTDKSCYTASNINTSSAINLPFGVNQTFNCLTS